MRTKAKVAAVKLVGALILLPVLQDAVKADESTSSTPPSCTDSKSDFSGIPTLTYATVTGDGGSKDVVSTRLYFHPQHPSKCTSADDGACKGKAYIVPGNTVAIGASCNGWDYVQYLGEKSVTTGWVDDGRLGNRQTPKQVQSAAASNPDAQPVFHFQLTKGHGVPVCEAYLQRLNQTSYDDHPYCGLPESDQVPGFKKLNRVYWSTDHINDLYAAVDGFLRNHQPSHYYVAQKDGSLVLPSAKDPVFPPKSRRSTWSYDPPVDIENDGAPDKKLVIWNTDDRDKSSCGIPYGPTEQIGRQFSEALFLSADGNSVDKDRTSRVFGQQDRATSAFPDRTQFKPFGKSYGIFEYEDTFYFETFFDSAYIANVDGIPNTDSRLQDTLAVFLNKNGVTNEMCHYYVEQ